MTSDERLRQPKMRVEAKSVTLAQWAVHAVAKRYSATLQSTARPSGVHLTAGGRPIALDVAVLAPLAGGAKRGATQPTTSGARVRLREDRVVQRVMCDLEHALNPQLKHGRTIILTLGAPIKVASKLVAALTDTLAACLESGAEEVDVKRIILGNRVRFRIVNARFRWAAQLIGFVFTGDPSPINLANTMSSLYDAIAKPTSVRKPAKGASERWLVLAARDWIADIKTFRRAYSKMAPPHDYKRILIVPEGGQVEILTGDD